MPKYDFSYGKLNNIKLPQATRSYDLAESTHYGSAVKASEMAYTPDILEDISNSIASVTTFLPGFISNRSIYTSAACSSICGLL